MSRSNPVSQKSWKYHLIFKFHCARKFCKKYFVEPLRSIIPLETLYKTQLSMQKEDTNDQMTTLPKKKREQAAVFPFLLEGRKPELQDLSGVSFSLSLDS